MTFDPKRGAYYRAPVVFGPTPGPRQWPQDEGFDPADQITINAATRFLTRAEQLEALLPDPRFELLDEPVVTLDVTWMRNIPWLAGRGYAMSDFKFPVRFNAASGPVHATFVLVRWENLADPIISGRDELGHSKLYCEIDEPLERSDRLTSKLSWLGCCFAELELSELQPAERPAPDPRLQGQVHQKYVPATGEPGCADAHYITLSPIPRGASPMSVVEYRSGQGRFDYRPIRWRDFPFCHHVVTAIAELDVLEWRGAEVVRLKGGATYPGHDTRKLD